MKRGFVGDVWRLLGLTLIALVGGYPGPAMADRIVWDITKTGSQNWSTAANWEGGQVPTNTDDVFFGAVDAATTVGDIYDFQSLTATNTGGGDLVFNLARNVSTTNGGGICIVSGTYAVNFNGLGRNIDLGSGSLLVQGGANATARFSPGNAALVRITAGGGITCKGPSVTRYGLFQPNNKEANTLDIYADLTLDSNGRFQRIAGTTFGLVNLRSNVLVSGTGANFSAGRPDFTGMTTDRVYRVFSQSAGTVTVYDGAVLSAAEASVSGGTFNFTDNPNFPDGQLQVDGDLAIAGGTWANTGGAILDIGGRLLLTNEPVISLNSSNAIRLR